jgi:Peptidase_C39 like family
MLSAVITMLLLGIMLAIIVGLVISALRERKRYMRTLKAQNEAPAPTAPLSTDVTLVIRKPDGAMIGVARPASPPIFTLPSSWYTRRRTLISLAFLLMALLTFFVQAGLTDGKLLQEQIAKGISFLSYNQPTDIHTPLHPVDSTAAQLLVRVDSADRRQYHNDFQYNVWSYSSCSGIAMEMVMNAYGRHLIAADVLQEELNLGVWSVRMGLLREEGITMTASYFGFNASLSHLRTLDDIINLANKGFPIIVSVRDSYYFPGGHIFVVRGGDSQYVYIADSSPANFQRMTRAMFLGMWQRQSFSALLRPR